MTLARDAVNTAVSVGLAGWVVGTALNQHPNRVFDFARSADRTGMLVPNWRFFAPNPAIHDFRIAHRVLFHDGSVGDWEDTRVVPQRTWWNSFWFPGRRRDKGITDLVGALTENLMSGADRLERTTPFRVLAELVRAEVTRRESVRIATIEGFQFVIGRDAGFDEEEPSSVFLASGLIGLSDGAAQRDDEGGRR